MEAVGRLAGGIAHDFNNLLTVISGYIELLLRRQLGSSVEQEWMRGVQSAAQRAAALTRQLLAFGRQQVLTPEPLVINRAIENSMSMLQRVISEDIRLRAELDPEAGWICADAGRLEQVLINLVINARDAMPHGGEVCIASGVRHLADDDENDSLPAGSYGSIRISDTGVGMTPEMLARIFEPFYTTKEVGKGTGLGLALVYSFIQQSGGDLRATSAPGAGSTFEILLPQIAAPPLVTPEAAPAFPAAKGGRETILIVEDEPPLRALVQHALAALGYTVLEARSGPEALQRQAAYRGRIDLLLTDVVMPGMSGAELALQIRALQPAIAVLLMSGYPDRVAAATLAGFELLPKPFTPDQLADRVRALLDGEAAQGRLQ